MAQEPIFLLIAIHFSIWSLVNSMTYTERLITFFEIVLTMP